MNLKSFGPDAEKYKKEKYIARNTVPSAPIADHHITRHIVFTVHVERLFKEYVIENTKYYWGRSKYLRANSVTFIEDSEGKRTRARTRCARRQRI